MMIWDEKAEAFWKRVKLIAFSMLVFSPIAYAVIGYILDIEPRTGGEFDMMLYILLMVAIVQPALGKIIARYQVDAFRKNPEAKMTRDQVYLSLAMIEMAFVDAIYLYGLLQVLLTADYNRMLYFYPIGIAWTFMVWPKRSNFEEFVNKMETNYGS